MEHPISNKYRTNIFRYWTLISKYYTIPGRKYNDILILISETKWGLTILPVKVACRRVRLPLRNLRRRFGTQNYLEKETPVGLGSGGRDEKQMCKSPPKLLPKEEMEASSCSKSVAKLSLSLIHSWEKQKTKTKRGEKKTNVSIYEVQNILYGIYTRE